MPVLTNIPAPPERPAGHDPHLHTRCTPCARYRKAYLVWREQNMPDGGRTVDASPSRRRLREFVKEGWTTPHIGAVMEMDATHIPKVLNGRQQRITFLFEERILTRWPTFANAPDVCLVPSFGVARRIEALYRLGHTTQDLRAFSGTNFSNVRTQRRVDVRVHREVDAAYQALQHMWGGNEVTIARAVARGYAPPGAWEDIDRYGCRPRL